MQRKVNSETKAGATFKRLSRKRKKYYQKIGLLSSPCSKR